MVNATPSVAELIIEQLDTQSRSVRWLSETTGIPYSTLSRKVRGKADIGANEMVVIADALGVHPSVITPAIFKSAEAVA